MFQINLFFRISWRRHALDSAEMDKPESEDEICDSASKKGDNIPTVDENGAFATPHSPLYIYLHSLT